MLNIFRHLDLFDLLTTIMLTSPQLADLRATACRQRHSLTLLLGGSAESLLEKVFYKFENLPPIDPLSKMVFSEMRFNTCATHVLTASLVNITTLVVSLGDEVEEDEFEQVIQLLDAWADQLTSLIIIDVWCSNSKGGSTLCKWTRLQSAINSLTRLRHLTLYMPSREVNRKILTNTTFDLPVMSHLESFNGCLPMDRHYRFFPSMRHYFVDNDQARSIDSYGFIVKETVLTDLLSMPPTVARLFRSVRIWRPIPDHQWLRFSGHFTGLRSLTLLLSTGLDILALPLLTRHLRSLTVLTTLGLGMTSLARHLNAIQAEREKLPPGKEQVLEALPSVTYLKLYIKGQVTSHDDLAALHLDQMLPNLKKLLTDGELLSCKACKASHGREGVEEVNFIFDEGENDDDEEEEEKEDEEDEEKKKKNQLLIEERTACVGQLLAPIRPLFPGLELTQVGFQFFTLAKEVIIKTLP